MNKHWENLLLDDNRPRTERTNQLPVGPEKFRPRKYYGTRDEELAADMQCRCKLPPFINVDLLKD